MSLCGIGCVWRTEDIIDDIEARTLVLKWIRGEGKGKGEGKHGDEASLPRNDNSRMWKERINLLPLVYIFRI